MPFNNSTKSSFFLAPGFIITAVLVLFLAIFTIGNYVKFHNLGVSSENEIKALYDSNQNNLGQLTLKVKEALGVAKLNNAELDKIIKDALQGRYGDNGQGAQQAMLWVKEAYPGQYDPSLMRNVQQAILSGRTDFEVKQNILIDRVRVYRNQTEFVWSGFWLGISGYPKLKWDDYKPVISQQAKETFETKIDNGMEIK